MVSEQSIGALKTLSAIVGIGTLILSVYLWWSLISKFPEDHNLWTIFVAWFIAVFVSTFLGEAVKKTTNSSRSNLNLGGKYGV